ncbi:MAG: DUF2975 domain-containing protein [Clostridia bacterium]|nr:DUF2975 domain-containing protein [Clostridia bacterium]
MLKIPTKASIFISTILAALFLLGCLIGAFFLPQVTNGLIDARYIVNGYEYITAQNRIVIHVLAYAALADVVAADIFLFFLLVRVKSGEVFTKKSVALIRGVSWCCIILGLIFAALGIYFYISFIVAFAAIFLGLCIRVVKNVIEQATEIKQENDLTV